MVKRVAEQAASSANWTFLSNHAHVLLCIVQNRQVRLVEISRLVGIGERAVHSIVSDLVDAGYVTRHKRGRQNHYQVDLERPLRHPLESDHQIAEIFKPFTRQNRSRN